MKKKDNNEKIERLASALREYREHKPDIDFDLKFMKKTASDFHISFPFFRRVIREME